ncbi:MAG: SOS response-associated peptidase [Hahellaceae bacterium]|nr:SOS response-associated peptidase [Hahellaceae bacterium]
MCGRLNLTDAPGVIQLMADLGFDTRGLQPRDYEHAYNLAPTERVVVGLKEGGQHLLKSLIWWLTPAWAPEISHQYAMFNARGETVASSPAFREAFRATRCLIPATGFIEWQQRQGVKTPLLIEPPGPFCCFAGLWTRWRKNPHHESFAIITAASQGAFAGIHSRMPVFLEPEAFDLWLDASAPLDVIQSLIASKPFNGWRATPVSSRVSNSRNKDADCLAVEGEATALDGV